jgi:hypothetical protein
MAMVVVVAVVISVDGEVDIVSWRSIVIAVRCDR